MRSVHQLSTVKNQNKFFDPWSVSEGALCVFCFKLGFQVVIDTRYFNGNTISLHSTVLYRYRRLDKSYHPSFATAVRHCAVGPMLHKRLYNTLQLYGNKVCHMMADDLTQGHNYISFFSVLLNL